eukprot:TRINITY_DN9863_c0_g1_i1.p1 TRINITY_DN9863_c0_g1~~TRINITY_DN9863_c0_g1_i1.p1  ORF type:complete len:389 (-),score=22.16 TRINITY_DN9863_c0_g1_i1:3-1169(-)
MALWSAFVATLGSLQPLLSLVGFFVAVFAFFRLILLLVFGTLVAPPRSHKSAFAAAATSCIGGCSGLEEQQPSWWLWSLLSELREARARAAAAALTRRNTAANAITTLPMQSSNSAARPPPPWTFSGPTDRGGAKDASEVPTTAAPSQERTALGPNVKTTATVGALSPGLSGGRASALSVRTVFGFGSFDDSGVTLRACSRVRQFTVQVGRASQYLPVPIVLCSACHPPPRNHSLLERPHDTLSPVSVNSTADATGAHNLSPRSVLSSCGHDDDVIHGVGSASHAALPAACEPIRALASAADADRGPAATTATSTDGEGDVEARSKGATGGWQTTEPEGRSSEVVPPPGLPPCTGHTFLFSHRALRFASRHSCAPAVAGPPGDRKSVV